MTINKSIYKSLTVLIALVSFLLIGSNVNAETTGENSGIQKTLERANNNIVPFTDVVEGKQWYFNEVMEMRKLDIISGYPDGSFKPTNSISREHTAVLFARAMDLTPIREGVEFTDVPKTHRYYDEIQKVYRAGIFDGKGDGSFDARGNLTRAHMAAVLVRGFNMEEHTGYIFNDVGADHWAKDVIATIYMHGLASGNEKGEFMPQQQITRAHFSVLLYRSLFPEEALEPDKPLEEDPVTPKPDKPKPEEPKPEKSYKEQVNDLRKNNPEMFAKDEKMADTFFYGDELNSKILLETKDLVKQYGFKYMPMQYFGYFHNAIILTVDGESTTYDFSIREQGYEVPHMFLQYNFNLEGNHEIAKEMFKKAMPEHYDEIMTLVEERVIEGRKAAEEGKYVNNLHRLQTGKYYIQLGINYDDYISIDMMSRTYANEQGLIR